MSAATAPAVSYEKAPTQVLGRRFFAAVIDGIIVGAVTTGLMFALGRTENTDGTTSLQVTGVAALIILIVWPVAYWWVQEAIWGRTIGKAICGIRVVTREGGDAGAGQTLVRNLIRIGWIYSVCLLIGWIVALASGPRRTRTMDMLAGTVVVRS